MVMISTCVHECLIVPLHGGLVHSSDNGRERQKCTSVVVECFVDWLKVIAVCAVLCCAVGVICRCCTSALSTVSLTTPSLPSGFSTRRWRLLLMIRLCFTRSASLRLRVSSQFTSQSSSSRLCTVAVGNLLTNHTRAIHSTDVINLIIGSVLST